MAVKKQYLTIAISSLTTERLWSGSKRGNKNWWVHTPIETLKLAKFEPNEMTARGIPRRLRDLGLLKEETKGKIKVVSKPGYCLIIMRGTKEPILRLDEVKELKQL